MPLKMRCLSHYCVTKCSHYYYFNILRNVNGWTTFGIKFGAYDSKSHSGWQSVCEEKSLAVQQMAGNKDILYSSYLISKGIRVDPLSRKNFVAKQQRLALENRREMATPLIVEKILSVEEPETIDNILDITEENSPVTLPYSQVENICIEKYNAYLNEVKQCDWDNAEVSLLEDIMKRMEAYDKALTELGKYKEKGKVQSGIKNKSSKLIVQEDIDRDIDSNVMEYGTCDSRIPVSRVPCGGCGALLHCQDYALPGFIPKELFEGLNAGELRSVICQRCYFLKYHNTALTVRVSPEVYQKVLEPIKMERALFIVLVDLLDAPCSIWPGLIDILGTKRPVVVVGNKVDLLPADGVNHLVRVKESFKAVIQKTSLGKCNIKHVALVSALTGFGIENLITKIQTKWQTKGDIYLIGCTNSGKSSLFNALLGSDMCKTKASTLIRRATTSPWPGTTLNMLKFPTLRPTPQRLYERKMRLDQENVKQEKNKLITSDRDKAMLTGNIGRTFALEEPEEGLDSFSLNPRTVPGSSPTKKNVGINDSHPDYSSSKWCHDTPGAVQPDQMINLLTHDELRKVLPHRLIRPQTYTLLPGMSLFIGGLARLDLLECPSSVRFTVFAADQIQIHVVETSIASSFYNQYLGTEVLGVPEGGEERLKHWPTLVPSDIAVMSKKYTECCGDVVLSSAGWIALSARDDELINVRGWTPGGRGIFLRTPSMLPQIIRFKGRRLNKSPLHKAHRFLVPSTE